MVPPLLTALFEAGGDTAPVVTIGDRSLSRAELIGAACAVAAEIGGARRVAIDARADMSTVVAVVGCLIAGVAAVPVPPDSGDRELRHILADSGAELWLGTSRPDSALPWVPVDLRARGTSGLPEPPDDAPALIVYTSGTTGAPKGVILSRRAIAAGLDGVAQAWQWSPEDVLVHGLPLFHVHGLVLGVLGALRVGSPLVHTVRPTAAAYAAAGGSLYFGVPTVWSRVSADPTAARALAGARLLVSGSAPLPVPVFERLAALTGSGPVERYGMSETMITVSTGFDGERRPGWVGRPIEGVRTRLRTESGSEVPHDGESLGRLEVAGPTLFDGYLNDRAKTAATMTEDGWFMTGDIAVIDPEGFHRIVGRESVDMIKSGGYRIGAGEVEQALLAHPGVREAAVIGAPDADLGQRIVAYVVADVTDGAALIDFVATSLSVHKRPREVRVIETLPRNAMGKVQKKALLAGEL
ncbi:acyl-CoA synthetase [Nocardia paucivorans]|uniref:acyl-CoA synthetase n=1 Tax=Nocardia paucivorans TaxID=114259 RepID=UPI00030417A1|nr:acyl-CoA synthetase [Nocardia paucivorans]